MAAGDLHRSKDLVLVGEGDGKVRLPLLVWLAVAIGLALRLWFAGTSGVYLDEAQVLGIVTEFEVPALLRFLGSHEAHPPAFYLFLRGWLAVFGGSDAAAIAPSLLASLASIALGFGVVYRLTGSARDGTTAAWLIALSPTAVRYAGMVRPYAFLGLVVLAGLGCLLAFLRTGAWRASFGYGACSTLLVYTHNWSWLVLAALGIIALGYLRANRAPRSRTWRLVLVHVVVVLLFLPWLPSFLEQASGAGHFFVKGLGPTLAEATWVLTGIPVDQAFLVGAAVVALALAHRRAGMPLGPDGMSFIVMAIATVLLVTGLAIALSPLSPLLVSQCYAMLTPMLMAALAPAIGVQRAPLLLARGLLIVTLLAYGGRIAVMSRWVRSDMREIGAFLGTRVGGEDVVVVYPDYPAPTLARYFAPRGDVFTHPRAGLPRLIPFDRRASRDVDSSGLRSTNAVIATSAKAGRRLWYVTIENPSDYPRLRVVVEQALRQNYGNPACEFNGSSRPRLYEDMKVMLYELDHARGHDTVPPCS